jgi:hypothetical protein
MQNLEGISLLTKTKAEPSGYCTAWSMFFTELCLRNPEIPSSVLLDNIYDKLTKTENPSDYLKKVIRGYAGLVYEKFTKMLSVFFKEKVTIDMITVLRKSKNISDRIKAKKTQTVLNLLIDLEIKKLDPTFDSKTEMKNIKDMIKMMMPQNYTRKDRKEREKVDDIFKKLVWKKKILKNYDEFNEMVTPLLEDKMTMVPVVRDRRIIENEILTKVRNAQMPKNVVKITSLPNAKKGKTIKKASSPKGKTIKNCKANEIINPITGKCMRITTMIKQIIKKRNMPLREKQIDRFMDVARERKLPLGSEREITAALNILMNSGIIRAE